MKGAPALEALEHLLRLGGLSALLAEGRLHISDISDSAAQISARANLGTLILLLQPTEDVCTGLDIRLGKQTAPHWQGQYRRDALSKTYGLRGIAAACTYEGDELQPAATSNSGASVWAWKSIGRGGVLLIGSDLVGDVLCFRQGDPARKPIDDELAKWGYSGERPNYLFDGYVDQNHPHDRPADWLLFALVNFVEAKTATVADPLLPHDAACAVVITGDTDGATAEHYAQQRLLLGDLPITYFLRTACAVEAETLRALDADPRVDLQLHPDALDAPNRYGTLLDQQIAWFEETVGRRPSYVRNHGYLNDGYWRHANHWIRSRITWSANLPGVDGLVLNGSLLPARLQLEGCLTPHWSLLTPYGDGMMFALGLSGQEAASRIEDHIEEIRMSGLPGLITINLHPANVGSTRPLHEVLHRLIGRNVLAWSLQQCAAWFERRDASPL